MDEQDTYLKLGEQMIFDGVLNGILDISERYPVIGIQMLKFWNGEISWEEQIDMIIDEIQKKT
ncbi:TPA: hypothetical protein KNO10_002151 [Clostridioides difficile]|uniref:hypothetical protein n=1 Tax=Clostridioides difficile TaxID=1496 RepID=UPI00038C954C|nr:hypothetical protein [Clostridioides difficile]EQG38334.1 hypothetical protein QIO_0534 [Clostridioides difficile DA00129]SJQ30754.1 Uncharacterised protein [Clostridioides difficile]SJR41808.1 Uncharacterised protein [Clostridioides difficile]HBF0262866.1 hypothetical protein [Clostridioides difficile]HBF0728999.1 hypothetical protein [Clostridioides difficile]